MPGLQESFSPPQVFFQARENFCAAKTRRHFFQHALRLAVSHVNVQSLAQKSLRALEVICGHKLLASGEEAGDGRLLRRLPERLEGVKKVVHRLEAIVGLLLEHLADDERQFFSAIL